MLSARARRNLLALGALYAAVVIPVGIRRGGDFVQELALSDRLIAGLAPLYTHNPGGGVFWPPFTIAALVPFALVARAGVWIGLATAVKMFPGLLLLYLAYRRRWRGLATGVAVALGLTWGAMLRYGPLGAVSAVSDWVALGRAAERAAGFRYQPLGVWVLGLGGSNAVAWLAMAVCIVLVAAALGARRGDSSEDPLYDVGLVTLLSVLLTPIGWFYYHMLAIPAWVAALTLPPPAGRGAARAWRATLVIAGVLLSGVLTFDYLHPAAMVLIYRFNYVWGTLVLLGALVAYHFVPVHQAQPA